ncbi:MAG: hypothetical protein AB7O37_05305 [Vicinamibacteria bacterium]
MPDSSTWMNAIRLLAAELSRDEDWQRRQLDEFARIARRYLVTG